jgi:hypothetical protein
VAAALVTTALAFRTDHERRSFFSLLRFVRFADLTSGEMITRIGNSYAVGRVHREQLLQAVEAFARVANPEERSGILQLAESGALPGPPIQMVGDAADDVHSGLSSSEPSHDPSSRGDLSSRGRVTSTLAESHPAHRDLQAIASSNRFASMPLSVGSLSRTLAPTMDCPSVDIVVGTGHNGTFGDFAAVADKDHVNDDLDRKPAAKKRPTEERGANEQNDDEEEEKEEEKKPPAKERRTD